MRKLFPILASLVLASVASFTQAGTTIKVAAAISMKEALIEANIAFMNATGDDVELTCDASGVLLTQIRNGAPMDAFISAAVEQVDAADKAGLVVKDSRRVIALNSLVLIVPAKSELNLTSIADLAKPEVKKVAVGQPKAVPAGQYAMRTLAALKLDKDLAGKIINGTNVRQVLDYVIRGEVDAGFVYATDAQQAGAKVKVIATAPADSHDPVVYPGVLLTAGKNVSVAKKFFEFLASPAGKKILESHGFLTGPTKSPEKPKEKAAVDAAEPQAGPRLLAPSHAPAALAVDR